jgi:hypothetical protein
MGLVPSHQIVRCTFRRGRTDRTSSTRNGTGRERGGETRHAGSLPTLVGGVGQNSRALLLNLPQLTAWRSIKSTRRVASWHTSPARDGPNERCRRRFYFLSRVGPVRANEKQPHRSQGGGEEDSSVASVGTCATSFRKRLLSRNLKNQTTVHVLAFSVPCVAASSGPAATGDPTRTQSDRTSVVFRVVAPPRPGDRPAQEQQKSASPSSSSLCPSSSSKRGGVIRNARERRRRRIETGWLLAAPRGDRYFERSLA